MVPDIYKLLFQCVETGLAFGWNRAHKHTPKPEPEYVRECQHDAVMHEISEWFHFTSKGELT